LVGAEREPWKSLAPIDLGGDLRNQPSRVSRLGQHAVDDLRREADISGRIEQPLRSFGPSTAFTSAFSISVASNVTPCSTLRIAA